MAASWCSIRKGNLLSTTDPLGYAITYALHQRQADADHAIAPARARDHVWQQRHIEYVAGPESSGNAAQRASPTSTTTSSRLTEVDTQALQGDGTYTTARSTKYQYNASNQISGRRRSRWLDHVDQHARPARPIRSKQDVLGNMVDYSFTQNATTGITRPRPPTWATAGQQPDRPGHCRTSVFAPARRAQPRPTARPARPKRPTPWATRRSSATQATALAAQYGDAADPNRPAISIQRNAANLPTVINDPANTGGTPVQISLQRGQLPLADHRRKRARDQIHLHGLE